eukprot:m.13909 g.13909  ORF g.13909 m.13909 type:complete len:318 (+) comp25287_c0_seq2:744-1697(+)
MVARGDDTVKGMGDDGRTSTTAEESLKPSQAPVDDVEGAVMKKKGSFMITGVRQGNSGDTSLLEGAILEDDDDEEAENESAATEELSNVANGPLQGGPEGEQSRFQLVNLRRFNRGRWKCLDTIPETAIEPPANLNGRGSPTVTVAQASNGRASPIGGRENHQNHQPMNGGVEIQSQSHAGRVNENRDAQALPPLRVFDDTSSVGSAASAAQDASSRPAFSRQTSAESINDGTHTPVPVRRDSDSSGKQTTESSSNYLQDVMDKVRVLFSSAMDERLKSLTRDNERLREENMSLRIENENLRKEPGNLLHPSKDRRL